MAKRARPNTIDRELVHLPPGERQREWTARVEAVIFASAEPVSRRMLERVVGQDCDIETIIEDIREALRDRPYELVSVAGGWQHRTRPDFADVIHASGAANAPPADLTQHQALVLMTVGYLQPVTRAELSKIFGREVSRDTIAILRQLGFLASGPRSPTPGAPYTYVTTPAFLSAFGFDTLRDLPDAEMLEDAGLLSRNLPPDDFIEPELEEGDD
ncbi:segregation and condensation protein B [Xaviernesmea oryzae]|uniref:Segregation and condensation protein B n=1 Tax=Xaviernesmea oryzae TaxID=464029 RepID=A0A1X7DSD9_9HYPH|nr:SMC-Scp complex subunit ScpB [Xaviernesmea oryzae]SMF20414.1 segregation and condensation protein B [Xaviernesmea oryzae]